MAGASALIEKTDWTPLAGKTVVIWPDNDAVGLKMVERVRPVLEGIGCTVKVVQIPETKPLKWDADDAIKEGEDVNAIIQAAQSFTEATTPDFKFNITFFKDIQTEHHKSWIIRDIFGANELSVVYGAPGCGKSVLIGDAAAHVASGRRWFGKRVKQTGVIYVAAERHNLVKRRFAAWRKFHGVSDPPLVVLDGMFNLASDPLHADEIVKILRFAERTTGHQFGWIIVDTKAQVMGGSDENASKDVAILNNNLARLQATGAHVTVIDHTPQSDPKRMKGNGGLAGAADGSFLVEKKGDLRVMSVGSKSPNDGPDDIEIKFNLKSVLLGSYVNDDGETEDTNAPVVMPASGDDMDFNSAEPAKPKRLGANQQKVMEAVQAASNQGDKLGFTRLQMMTGIEKGALGGVLRKLVAEGLLIEVDGPTRVWVLA
jgi:hypothetical protein